MALLGGVGAVVKESYMRAALSILVLGLCCLWAAAFILVGATILPHTVIHDSEGWQSMLFVLRACPWLAGTALFLGMVPSALMFWKGGRRTIDRVSLCISGATLALIGIAVLLLEPLRKAIIFKQSDMLWSVAFFLIPVGIAILFALGFLAALGYWKSGSNRTRIVRISLLTGAAGAACALLVLIAIRLHLSHLDEFRRHVELGTTARLQGRFDEAIAHCRKALETDPNNAEVHYNLGRALAEARHLDAAIAEFRKALSIKPDDAKTYYRLGCALAATGRRDETVAAFRNAVMLKPDFPEARRQLRWAEDWARESNSSKGAHP